ncbi:MAG: flagellar motor switch protein FliN [Thermodesulfobacteriota bacterium]
MTNEAAKKEEEVNAGQALDDQWGEALSEQGAEQEKAAPAPAAAAPKVAEIPKPRIAEVKKPDAKPASFGTLSEENAGTVGNMNMVLDIPVTISVEIGRTKMMIKDLLQLGQGTVVELEKLAGEPLEILVNGRLLARGEAVVVNEKFGIKLTDIVSPSERISKLG